MHKALTHPLWPTGLAILLVMVGFGIVNTSDRTAESSGGTPFMDALSARGSNLTRYRSYDSVAGAATAAAAVVTGRFVAVVPGRGFSWTFTDTGEEVRHEHEFDSPAAWVNTVHATLQVTDTSRSAARQGVQQNTPLTIGFTIDPGTPADQVARELADLGDVVVLLASTAVYDYQPGVYGVLEDGTFIGRVDSAGSADFMLLDPQEFGLKRSPVQALLAAG